MVIDVNLFMRKKDNNLKSQTLVNAGEKTIRNNSNKVKPTFQNYLTRGNNRNYNFRYDGNGNLI